ncbi:VanZ family protein [Agromyces intestinalis]|nr:VanZ family protein [Agromyces intestinalis]
MDRLMPGLIAILFGALVLLVVFVPLVALSYRRRGGFSAARFAGWIALLFYAIGLWAYTLLPFPEPGSYTCVGAVLNPFEDVVDILRRQAAGESLPRNPALQQAALNVLLFAPLGVFARLLFGRGVVVATIAGAAVSLAIELTQLTGLWGVFSCAYRVFDTGDLVTNTAGAIIGSLLAVPVVRRVQARHRPEAAPAASGPVSVGRRLLAMLADWLSSWLLAGAAAVPANAAVLVLAGRDRLVEVGDTVSSWSAIVPILAQLWSVLATGATLGEHATLIEAIESRRPVLWWRLVRFGAGIGGYLVLAQLPAPFGLTAFGLAVASIVVAFTSRGHRGLAQAAAGMDARGLVRSDDDTRRDATTTP